MVIDVKRIKVLLLIMMVGLVSGCASKFQGTWCRYSDVATSLVILDYDISDEDLYKITEYVKTIENLKSFDVIDKIEEASKMVTIYYKNEDNIEEYQNTLKTYNGVRDIKFTSLNTVLDKLVIKRDSFILDKDLNELNASEIKGTYTIENNTLKLDNNTELYYKNKFLCYDKNCDELLTKAKGAECIN